MRNNLEEKNGLQYYLE